MTSFTGPLGQGPRQHRITIACTLSYTGTLDNLTDGTQAAEAGLYFNGETGDGTKYLSFDLGLDNSVVVDAFKWRQSTSTSLGNWSFQGSNSGSSWDTLWTGTLGGAATTTKSFTNTTAYRYYRLLHNSGATSNTPDIYEIEFQTAGPSESGSTTYYNEGGMGDRTALITVSTFGTFSITDGPISKLVDGLGPNNVSTMYWATTAGAGTAGIKFDFGVSASKVIDAFTQIQGNDAASHGNWSFQGSDNDADWTNLWTGTLGSASPATERTFTNTTGFRYYRLLHNSGVRNNSYELEVEFKIAEAGGGGGGGGTAGGSSVVIMM